MTNDTTHFDRWAEVYDIQVPSSTEFPLAGYAEGLSTVLQLAEVEEGMKVLDLGTGTGNVAGLFADQGCSVWGTDSSPGMLERARAKFPNLDFALSDLRADLPPGFPQRFDRIVSAYAFHHLDLDGKLDLMEALVRRRLGEGGQLLVLDVAFATQAELDEAQERWADGWDHSEFYWVADEVLERARSRGLTLEFTPTSFCAGVFGAEVE